MQVALQLCPAAEVNDDNVVFDIAPLRKWLGPPNQVAAEICRLGQEREIQANLAIAPNPDTAILLARHWPGVTFASPGEEHFKLAGVPLSDLTAHVPQMDDKLFEGLQRWGLQTCGELAALNANAIAERLGPPGLFLHQLACGRVDRPLHLSIEPVRYQRQMELEHPLEVLEPLLFLVGSALRELCEKLKSQSMGARVLRLHLRLEGGEEYRCELEFPLPIYEVQTLLKLLQLHMERHSPEAAVLAFHLQIDPATPKRVQNNFFVPAAPLADRLELTLARLRGMVGNENVITPYMLDTHRPDAFKPGTLHTGACDWRGEQQSSTAEGEEETRVLRFAMRLFRPALPAKVRMAGRSPRAVSASRVRGEVVRWAGPWKTSGEWWAKTSWARVEWDVALNDGGLYRIYQEMTTSQWFIYGIYD